MNQRVSSLTIGGAIIVAGLLVAAAIVFGPQMSGLVHQHDPKKADDGRSESKSDLAPGQQHAEPSSQQEKATLDVITGKLLVHESMRGWFFIDGTYYGNLREQQKASDDD